MPRVVQFASALEGKTGSLRMAYLLPEAKNADSSVQKCLQQYAKPLQAAGVKLSDFSFAYEWKKKRSPTRTADERSDHVKRKTATPLVA
jgi:hypothetical protein